MGSWALGQTQDFHVDFGAGPMIFMCVSEAEPEFSFEGGRPKWIVELWGKLRIFMWILGADP